MTVTENIDQDWLVVDYDEDLDTVSLIWYQVAAAALWDAAIQKHSTVARSSDDFNRSYCILKRTMANPHKNTISLIDLIAALQAA
jgi:hypothetical protein